MLYSLYHVFEQYANLYEMSNKTATKHLIQKFRSLIIACSYENRHTISRDVVLTKKHQLGEFISI